MSHFHILSKIHKRKKPTCRLHQYSILYACGQNRRMPQDVLYIKQYLRSLLMIIEKLRVIILPFTVIIVVQKWPLAKLYVR